MFRNDFFHGGENVPYNARLHGHYRIDAGPAHYLDAHLLGNRPQFIGLQQLEEEAAFRSHLSRHRNVSWRH